MRLLVVAAELVRQARVRVARDPRRREPREVLDERAHLGRAERAVDADDERRACSTDVQNASTVWPERLRPLWSTAVNESHSGSSGATSSAATIAALALSVSKIVSIEQQVDAALAQRADLLRVRLAHLRRRSTARYAGSSTCGESESVTFSGPIDAGDEARLSGVARPVVGDAAGEPRAFDVHLADASSSP